MFKYLAICVIMLQTLNAQCQTGCLKCQATSPTDSTKICVLCDTINKYYLKDGKTCVKTDLANCAVIDHNNKCLLCNKSYFLDQEKCTLLDVKTPIEFCETYKNNTQCLYCNSQYYLDGTTGKCAKATKTITNCQYFLTATTCAACVDGYYTSDDLSTCNKFDGNCLTYTQFKCETCASKFVRDKTLYQESFYKFVNNAQRDNLVNILTQSQLATPSILNLAVCRAATVENCAIYTTYATCEKCLDGYYLDKDKKCIIFPEPIIENCLLYVYYSGQSRWQYKCTKCKDKYYVKSEKFCTAVTNIDNCQTYDQTTTNTGCVECVSDYYLSGNACTARTFKSIANCSVYEKGTDKCNTCATGKVMSSDGLLCLSKIDRCTSHVSFTSQATQTQITCSACENGFYLAADKKSCTAGTNANCLTYDQNTGACVVCKDRYFGTSSDCVAQHGEILQCTDYSSDAEKYCFTCSTNFTPLQIKKTCKTFVTKRQQCIEYEDLSSTSSKCKTCATDYYVNANGDCVALTGNCAAAGTDGACTACKTGYYQVTDKSNNNTKQCVLYPSFVRGNCAKTPTSLSLDAKFSSMECQECNEYQSVIKSVQSVCLDDAYKNYLNIKTTVDNSNGSKFKEDGSPIECKETYYLDKTTNPYTCKTTCAETIYPLVVGNKTGLGGRTYGRNVCDTKTGTPRLAAISLESNTAANNDAYSIIACKGAGNLFVQTQTHYTNFHVTDTLANNKPTIAHVADVWPAVTCTTFAGTDKYDNATRTADYFNTQTDRIYIQLVANNFGTVKCPFGNIGTITTYVVTNTTYAYLDCSSISTTTFKSDRYYNVPVAWSNLFSIHACASSSQIPLLVYKGTGRNDRDFSGFTKWTLDRTGNYAIANAEAEQKNIICLNNASKDSIMSQLGTATGNTVWMQYCGLAVLNLAQTDKTATNNTDYDTDTANLTDDKNDLFCAACAPGYKPTKTDGRVVRKCVAIANCNLSSTNNKLFNGCGQCNSSYTWQYDSTNDKIKFDTCVKVPTQATNCMAWVMNNVNTDDGKGYCKFCNDGYYLNADKLCERITVSNCDSFVKPALSGSVAAQQYLARNGYECTSCKTGFYNVQLSDNNGDSTTELCYTGEYFTQNSFTFEVKITDDTARVAANFTQYCAQYNKDFVCIKCMTNYILTQSTKQCASLSGLENCEIAKDNKTDCHQCNKKYNLENNKCVSGSTRNCKEFNYLGQQATSRCITCENGYYLRTTDNSCEEGYVPQCLTYTSNEPTSCTSCATGFWLFYAQNGTNAGYCFPIDSTMNCKKGYYSSISNTQNGVSRTLIEINCLSNTECVEPEMKLFDIDPKSTTDVTSKCYGIPKIANCDEYEQTTTLGANSFNTLYCKKCSIDYYLDPNNHFKCIKREKNYDNCLTRKVSEDKCDVCNDDYYFDPVLIKCVGYPKGFYGCTAYDAADNCIECDDNHYMAQNKACILVTVTSEVPNCRIFASPTTCKTCSSTYYLTADLKCTKITDVDCISADTNGKCTACKTNKVVNDTTNKCETLDTKCVTADQTKKTCILCDTNYYVNTEGKCSPGNTPAIDNCAELSDASHCKRCAATHALSADATKCQIRSGQDGNCVNTKSLADLTCSICKAGYDFVNEVCQKNTKATIENGCFDEDASGNCVVCIPGWSMGTNGSCTNNNPPTTNNNGVGIVGALVGLLMMLLFQVI